MGRAAREFEAFYKEVSRDVFSFCKAMNFKPTWQQALLLDAVNKGYKRIACKSGQGPGKTTVSTLIGLWRLFRSYKALTVVTAPTMRQCKDVWLSEARMRIENAHPHIQKMMKVTKSKVEVMKETDWCVQLVTATKAENAQGFHRSNMTVIAEEASGISREIMEQFKGTLSNPDNLFLMIGNPNTRDCAFFDCFNSQRHNWHCITFNAEESPPEIVSPERNRLLEEEFGRDSDVYRVRVLGEFPHTDPNCVISSEQIEQCIGHTKEETLKVLYKHILTHKPPEAGGGLAKQFGIDFARFGGDESTIFRRSGNSIPEWRKYNHVEPDRVVDEAFRMQYEAGWKDAECVYVVDAGGMGQGLLHKFYNAGKRVVEFHSAGKPVDQQYDNKITEAWFTLAKKIKAKNCHIPNDNILIQQLCGRQYFTTKKGKLILESKDDYLERNENSPDRADGLVMAFYDHATSLSNLAVKGHSKDIGMKVRIS